MNNLIKVLKNNIKLYIILSIIVLLGIIGVTYSATVANFKAIGINTTSLNLDAYINYETETNGTSIVSNGNLLPINDEYVTGPDVTDTRVLKVTFDVTGANTNPTNTIYDIALHNIDIDCELRTTDLKWRLYKEGTDEPISQGNLSPTFDTMADNRLVLTETQEDLSTTATKYTFLLWISESCTGDISSCDPNLVQNKYLNKNLSAEIKVELATKGKKKLTRITGSEASCDYTEIEVPLCNNLTYNKNVQTLVSSDSNFTAINNTGINAGEYAVTLKLEDGYKWSNGSTDNKVISCSINKKPITITTLKQNIAYGNDVSSTVSDVTVDGLLDGHSLESISIVSTTVEVGTSNLKASNAVIVDSDGNNVTYNYNINYNNAGELTIAKLESVLLLASNNFSVGYSETQEISYDYVGDGKLDCSSSDTNVAGCSIDFNEKTVNVEALDIGSAVVTVTATEGKGYSDAIKSIDVTVVKSDPVIEFSTNKLDIYYPQNVSFTYTYNGDGDLSCQSSNTSVLSCEVVSSSNKIIVYSVGAGESTITLSASSTDKYNATSKSINATVTLPTYTISYDANGGSNAPSSQTKTYGVPLTLSDTVPTRTGYVFLGWSKNSEATNATYKAGGEYNVNANTTLYAVWRLEAIAIYSEDDYSLTFYVPSATETINVGDDYNGKTVTALYTGFETSSSVPWSSCGGSIQSVVVKDKIYPKSTASWFNGFNNCTSIDISKLDTSNVTKMGWMFQNCSKITTLDVSNWDTSNVTDMIGMFMGCSSLTTLDVSNWNTSKVKDMGALFYGCSNLTTLDVSNFDTSSVTSMVRLFSGCSKLTTLDLSNFVTSSVKDMNQMFRTCTGLTTLDLSTFDTSSVTNMSYMFYGCTGLTALNVSNWNTSSVRDMSGMFQNCTGFTTLNLSNWNTSSLTNVGSMFQSCSGLTTLNLSNWNTSSLTNMGNTFYSCSNLTTLDLSNWDTSSVTSMSGTFAYCNKLNNLDVSGFDTGNVTNMYRMFENCSSLTTLDVSNWDTSNVSTNETMIQMFSGCSSLETLDVSKWNVSKVKSMNAMFKGCSSLKTLDVSNWDTSSVTNMVSMFQGCSSLTTLDVSDFNTTSVTDMSNMFYGCSGVSVIDVSNWDTSSATKMGGMFNGCSGVSILEVGNFDTSDVTTMGGMFQGCSGLTTLDVSNWDTSSATNMDMMFAGCTGLTTLDVSNFNTSKVTSSYRMFMNCSNLEVIDVSGFDTSINLYMLNMFDGCTKITTLDLSNWDTSSVLRMPAMFQNCTNLTTIYVSDKWSTASVQLDGNMFKGCTSLVGGAGTVYSSSHIDKTYARIDGGVDNPGYFTDIADKTV